MRYARHRARRLVHRPLGRGEAGFTFIELYVVCVILIILAAATFPIMKDVSRRRQEAELRYALESMRHAVDEYHRYAAAQLIALPPGSSPYPPDLETLAEPIELNVPGIDAKTKRLLRSIPVDPMTGEAEWGLRCVDDEWDSDYWCGDEVFDVYSLSQATGLNDIPYKEW